MQITRPLAISDRFIKRHTTFLVKRAPRLPQYLQKIFKYKSKAYYDIWRPWEHEFARLNQEGVRIPPVFVEPIKNCAFFRGDRVEVLKGPDQGKQGIINYIVKERNWVCVEGLNLDRKFINKTDTSIGVMTCREEPYLMDTEVQLVDPSDLLPTTVEWRYDDDGNKLRVSNRTGRVIPMPVQSFATIDYVEKARYHEQPKDTPAQAANKVTFKPNKSTTFEMDICQQMGIKDDRIPYPMYWY